jgi:hypothetical protein
MTNLVVPDMAKAINALRTINGITPGNDGTQFASTKE